MRTAAAESRATTAGKWLLAVVVPSSALALGSLPTSVLVVMSALAALSCGLLWSQGDVRTSRASHWILVALVLLLGMTLLQAIPMPAGVVRALTPANADVWDRALTPFHELAPAWQTLSVAPSATRVEVLRGVFYGCIFLAALRVAGLEGGLTFLERLVVASSCIMAVSTLAHAATSAERVFGIYQPKETYAFAHGRYGSLLNKNHLSAYLNLGACVAVGSLVARRAIPRALSLSAALVLAGTSIWAGSRGGAAALLFGSVLTVAMTLYIKRRSDSGRAEPAILALCAIAAATMVAIAVTDRPSLANRDFMKVGVALDALGLVPRSPWFGVGRGAFETAFPTVRVATSYLTFTHPENGFVQWTVEWGLPVALVAMVLLGRALRPNNVIRAVRPGVGAWAAIVAVVLSDLVDFHLEVPGIVALAAVCVAIAIGGRTSRGSRSSHERLTQPQTEARPLRVRRIALALVGATLLALAWAAPEVGHTLAEDRRSLSAMAVDRTISREAFDGALRSAILRYPGEAFFPLMGAVRTQSEEAGSVASWVGRALERNPRFGRAHLVLARSLGQSRAAQARLEYRLAYETDEVLRGAVVQEGSRLIVDTDSALELVPSGPEGVEMLDELVKLLQPRLPATAAILDAELLRRSPEATPALRRRVEAALSDVVNQHPWCAGGTACVDAGLADARALTLRDPQKCEGHVLVARLRVLKGETKEALDELATASETVTDRGYCQQQLIDMAFAAGDRRRADSALDRLVRAGCGGAADCLELYQWAAGAAERRDNNALAIALYRRASEAAPERDDFLEKMAELGQRGGTGLADAVAAYDTLSRRHPDDPRWAAKSAEVRAGTMKRAMPPPLPTAAPPDP